MKCLDRFNKKMSLGGMTLREENINNSRKLLEETFSDDASYMLGIYFWKLGFIGAEKYKHENPIEIRMYGRRYSAANGVVVDFQTLHDTPMEVGDIIYDSKADEYYICTESFDIDGIHYKGKVTLCNWILRWQNKKGEILEYPCFEMNTTQYNSGETANKQFTVSTSQHLILLPSDENTVVISTPQRFFLDKDKENPTSYIVTQNDTTSYNYGKKGIVRITVYQYPSVSESDRPDMGICDYIDIDKEDSIGCCMRYKSIIDYSTNIIKSGGDAQTFTAVFYDDKGNKVENISPHWTIVCDFSDKLKVKEFDNSLSIGIDDDSCIDEEFKLICSDEENDSLIIPSSLIIKVGSLL